MMVSAPSPSMSVTFPCTEGIEFGWEERMEAKLGCGSVRDRSIFHL